MTMKSADIVEGCSCSLMFIWVVILLACIVVGLTLVISLLGDAIETIIIPNDNYIGGCVAGFTCGAVHNKKVLAKTKVRFLAANHEASGVTCRETGA